MMKVITTNGGLESRFGFKESIRIIKEAGFDGYDYNMFTTLEDPDSEINKTGHIKFAKEVKKYADSLGFECTQTHSARAGVLSSEYKLDYDRYVDLQIKSLEVSAILGAKYCVVHPIINASVEDNFNYYYNRIIPVAEKLGVVVATENMYIGDRENATFYPSTCGFAEEFCKMIDTANSKFFVGCVDIGHAEMPSGEGAHKLLTALGHDRVKCLHVHDNTKIADDHFLPFTYGGRIRWKEIISALKEINYDGNFTFEADNCARRYPPDADLILSLFRHMCDIGKYFVNQIAK